MTRIQVEIPAHLRTLAKTGSPVTVEVDGDPTIERVLDALEEQFPVLRGTIREHGTRKRRAYMRYFAAGQDLSHEPAGSPLPRAVVSGEETFIVLGAIAGG